MQRKRILKKFMHFKTFTLQFFPILISYIPSCHFLKLILATIICQKIFFRGGGSQITHRSDNVCIRAPEVFCYPNQRRN